MGIILNYGSIKIFLTSAIDEEVVFADIMDEEQQVVGSPIRFIIGGKAQFVDTRKTKQGTQDHDTDMVCNIRLINATLNKFYYKVILEGSLYENKGAVGPIPFSFALEFSKNQALNLTCTYPLEVGGSNYIIEPDNNNSCLKYSIWEDPENAVGIIEQDTQCNGKRNKLDKFSGNMTTKLDDSGKSMTGTIKGLLSNMQHMDEMYMQLDLTYPYTPVSIDKG